MVGTVTVVVVVGVVVVVLVVLVAVLALVLVVVVVVATLVELSLTPAYTTVPPLVGSLVAPVESVIVTLSAA